MNILAIDAACSCLSIALSREDEIFYAETDMGSMKHSELVMDMIDGIVKKAALKPSDLDGCLCMGGPGSFTGLRIGYSIAKGLALSLSIPFAPIPTLDCIAYHCLSSLPQRGGDCLLLPVIFAGKNTFYSALFRGKERLKPDTDTGSSEIAETIGSFKNEKITVTGPAATALYDNLPPEFKSTTSVNCENRGYAREMILIGKDRDLFIKDNTAYLYSGPDYIRKTDAEIQISTRK